MESALSPKTCFDIPFPITAREGSIAGFFLCVCVCVCFPFEIKSVFLFSSGDTQVRGKEDSNLLSRREREREKVRRASEVFGEERARCRWLLSSARTRRGRSPSSVLRETETCLTDTARTGLRTRLRSRGSDGP